ncbi:TPR-like protein [Rhizoctonia solani]|uniref:TPR-like protein n=1 Tax=Rhizoctonia solani TaxID=456999 RepID=A0A8H7H0L2_9AGAM|nr:TPR-like protein [Rhizoctonia solani]
MINQDITNGFIPYNEVVTKPCSATDEHTHLKEGGEFIILNQAGDHRLIQLQEPHSFDRSWPLSTGMLEQLNNIKDLDQSTRLDLDDHVDLPAQLSLFAKSYEDKHQKLGAMEDLEKALAYHQCALDITPEQHTAQSLADLEKAIELQVRAISLSLDHEEDTCSRLYRLAMLYFHRFQRLGHLSDIDKAIRSQEQVVSVTPLKHESLAARLNNLGTFHKKRFQMLGNMDDIDRAIVCQAQAVSVTPFGHTDMANRLNNLAASYLSRFQNAEDVSDANKAIDLLHQAIQLIPLDHPNMPGQLLNLGNLHLSRFQCIGDLLDLTKSISLFTQSISLVPSDHPDLPNQLNNLGASYISRFQRLGNLSDVEESIRCHKEAAIRTPPNSVELPGRLSNLGASLQARFDTLGEQFDIDSAIECHTTALSMSQKSHAKFPNMLHNLAASYHARYCRLGGLDDIDKAIKHQMQAVVLTPVYHADLSGRLHNLGALYKARFERLGECNDIFNAIDYQKRGLSLTPPDHTEYPSRLASLGISYQSKFYQSGSEEDVDNAIEHLRQAVFLTPHDHYSRANRLRNLGYAYKARYGHFGREEDINDAIGHHDQAIILAHSDHASQAAILTDTGSSYLARFRRYGAEIDIVRAIELLEQAVALTPDGHPSLCPRLSELGMSYWSRYERLNDLQLPLHSINSLRLAAESTAGNPRDRFNAACTLARISCTLKLPEALHAYQIAVDLVPRMIWIGATVDQRYEQARYIGDIATEAAAAAISIGQYSLALEWLEQGRSVVFAQMVLLRTPIDDLHARHPDLANELQRIASELHAAESQSFANPSTERDPLREEMQAQQHRRLAMRYDEILADIRRLPEFEGFLQHRRAAQLVKAAHSGPVVIINAHISRCDALVLKPGESTIYHVPLDRLSHSMVNTLCAQLKGPLANSSHLRGVINICASADQSYWKDLLCTLWIGIVEPVLEFLGYLEPTLERMPRITWCTTGITSFLPLHAAGYYDRPKAKIFDFVISSYTPTLSALITSQSVFPRPSSSILAVGMEHTQGRISLPWVAKELAQIEEHSHEAVKLIKLTGKCATKSAVLDAIEQVDWVHLACHTHRNIERPMENGFILSDGVLELKSILQRPSKRKGLAFLSACQTAAGDTSLPDEALHLASGMLMAGYQSVIATMWSIVDEDAATVTERFYGHLLEEGMYVSDTAQALHCAVDELRKVVGTEDFARWVPYVHIGV